MVYTVQRYRTQHLICWDMGWLPWGFGWVWICWESLGGEGVILYHGVFLCKWGDLWDWVYVYMSILASIRPWSGRDEIDDLMMMVITWERRCDLRCVDVESESDKEGLCVIVAMAGS